MAFFHTRRPFCKTALPLASLGVSTEPHQPGHTSLINRFAASSWAKLHVQLGVFFFALFFFIFCLCGAAARAFLFSSSSLFFCSFSSMRGCSATFCDSYKVANSGLIGRGVVSAPG